MSRRKSTQDKLAIGLSEFFKKGNVVGRELNSEILNFPTAVKDCDLDDSELWKGVRDSINISLATIRHGGGWKKQPAFEDLMCALIEKWIQEGSSPFRNIAPTDPPDLRDLVYYTQVQPGVGKDRKKVTYKPIVASISKLKASKLPTDKLFAHILGGGDQPNTVEELGNIVDVPKKELRIEMKVALDKFMTDLEDARPDFAEEFENGLQDGWNREWIENFEKAISPAGLTLLVSGACIVNRANYWSYSDLLPLFVGVDEEHDWKVIESGCPPEKTEWFRVNPAAF